MKNIPIECLYIMIKDYGTKIKAMDKMLIILIWADGFISDQKFVKQVQKLVIESVPASEFDYQVLHQLSVTFHSSFGLFFPVSFVIEKFANIEKEFLVYKETSDQVKEKLKVHVSKLAVSLVPCGLNTKQFHVTIPILINKWLDEFMVE